jgi:hypothetical protein
VPPLFAVTLLPKLRVHVAEFLNQSSPVRLGLLDLPTSVGLRYGRIQFFVTWLFSARRPAHFCPKARLRTCTSIHRLSMVFPRPQLAPWIRGRTINRLSIGYAFWPRLRPASPDADEPCVGTLRVSAMAILTPLTLLMPTFSLPIAPQGFPLLLRCVRERSPTEPETMNADR